MTSSAAGRKLQAILAGLANLQEAKAALGRETIMGITHDLCVEPGNFSQVLDWLKEYKVVSSVELSTCSHRGVGCGGHPKMISLPVVRKEEDQILPFELCNIDVDIFYEEVQRTEPRRRNTASTRPSSPLQTEESTSAFSTYAGPTWKPASTPGRQAGSIRTGMSTPARSTRHSATSARPLQQNLEWGGLSNLPQVAQRARHLSQMHEVLCVE
jgi:hypothetical protein